jgi:hypothetical protein
MAVAGNSMVQSRRTWLSLLAVAALSTTIACTVVIIIGTASLSTKGAPLAGLSIIASTFDGIAVCTVALFSVHYVWKRGGLVQSTQTRHIMVICCVSVGVASQLVTLASFITIKRRLKEATPGDSRRVIADSDSYLAGQIATWILACLTQGTLYSVPMWKDPEDDLSSISHSDPRPSAMSEVRTSNHTANLYMMEPTSPTSPISALPSPAFSPPASPSLQSFGDSLHHIVRPMSSRTKLINKKSFTRDSQSVCSDTQSAVRTPPPDGFESWDTSSVGLQVREAVSQSNPSRGRVLEPIPGSRPASPANALNGPFPLEFDGSETLPPLPLYSETSRPPSPALSEAHIHPLFRSESPTPPPAATPGTSIIASPLANQIIPFSQRPTSRMRSNSRPKDPSPLVFSRNFHEQIVGAQSIPSRSPSPPSRELTPPIPDFVLNPTPRSSTSGAESNRNFNA